MLTLQISRMGSCFYTQNRPNKREWTCVTETKHLEYAFPNFHSPGECKIAELWYFKQFSLQEVGIMGALCSFTSPGNFLPSYLNACNPFLGPVFANLPTFFGNENFGKIKFNKNRINYVKYRE